MGNYVTLVGRPMARILHSEQIHSALADDGTRDLSPILKSLERVVGRRYGPWAGRNLVDLYRLEYSATWSSMMGGGALYRLRPEAIPALLQVSREPTDAECLFFIGGRQAYRDQSMENAFDYNTFFRWAAMFRYDFQAAFDWLNTHSLAEMIAEVRAYRARALAGEAVLPANGWRVLFPFQYYPGKWDKEALAWTKAHEIPGAAETRARRVHEALENQAVERMETVALKKLSIFPNKKAIAVLAGKGGVGKSTVAANLARALQKAGEKVLIFDADFYGPSQPLFFPVDNPRLRTQDGMILPHVVDGIEVISFGHLLDKDEALEWRGVYLQSAMHALATNLKTDATTVIFDMPPGTGDILLGLEQMCPQVGFVFVGTAGEVALADVRRAINTLDGGSRARIIGLVENMAYLDTANGRVQLWGGENDVADAAAQFHLRFLGKLPMGRDAESRLAAVESVLLPPALDFLAGIRFQKVALDVLVAEGKRVIDALERRMGESVSIHHVTDIHNLATFLEAVIRDRGGDPSSRRYHKDLRALMDYALAKENLRAAISDNFFRRTELPEDAWWIDYARQYHPQVFASRETPAEVEN